MKRSFASLAATVVTVLGLAGLVMAPDANAAGERRGGGGGGGGGNARAGQAQVNNTRADARTNNVRSTSVNNVNNNNVNVNSNRNVNVNVNNNNHNGWDNDYHPVAGAAVIAGTAALIGSAVRTVPAGCAPVNYAGIVYQQCGGTWYAPQGSQFVVVAPPY
jgi:hypothetical protein